MSDKREWVVFQKWKWPEIAVTLGLVFVASIRKEWPMTFIEVHCSQCQSDQIVKRSKTTRDTLRYVCQNTLCTKGSLREAFTPSDLRPTALPQHNDRTPARE
jgi:ribosomal protein S27E